MPLLCANAKPHVGAAPATPGASPGASPGGRKARAPSRTPSALAAEAAEAEQWAQLRAACLRALLEHLRFCARLSYVSYHLHTITFTVLECVDASGHAAPQVSCPGRADAQGVLCLPAGCLLRPLCWRCSCRRCLQPPLPCCRRRPAAAAHP